MANFLQGMFSTPLISPVPPKPVYGPPVPTPRPVPNQVAKTPTGLIKPFVAARNYSPTPPATLVMPPTPNVTTPSANNAGFLSYKPIIQKAASQNKIPANVLAAALSRESANFADKYVKGYHLDGTGRGIAGIDKVQHPEISDQQAFDPNFAINWMASKLGELTQKNGGSVYNALREYNGGPAYNSNRRGYQGNTVSSLTKHHADTIMQNATQYQSIFPTSITPIKTAIPGTLHSSEGAVFNSKRGWLAGGTDQALTKYRQLFNKQIPPLQNQTGANYQASPFESAYPTPTPNFKNPASLKKIKGSVI